MHMKKGRFAILADYDDGARSDTEEETSTTGLNSEGLNLLLLLI